MATYVFKRKYSGAVFVVPIVNVTDIPKLEAEVNCYKDDFRELFVSGFPFDNPEQLSLFIRSNSRLSAITFFRCEFKFRIDHQRFNSDVKVYHTECKFVLGDFVEKQDVYRVRDGPAWFRILSPTICSFVSHEMKISYSGSTYGIDPNEKVFLICDKGIDDAIRTINQRIPAEHQAYFNKVLAKE